jgi:hypothetical protein
MKSPEALQLYRKLAYEAGRVSHLRKIRPFYDEACQRTVFQMVLNQSSYHPAQTIRYELDDFDQFAGEGQLAASSIRAIDGGRVVGLSHVSLTPGNDIVSTTIDQNGSLVPGNTTSILMNLISISVDRIYSR